LNKRILLATGGLLLLFTLLIFGKTSIPKPPMTFPAQSIPEFNINDAITKFKQDLTSSQTVFISKIENEISRGNLKKQSEEELTELANFWKDSAKKFIPYSYYLSEAAKLDNSEKNLTFAARLILDNLKREDSVGVKAWEASTAADLFQRALNLDPNNDDLKVGLASCYIYGQGMAGDPQQMMKGIQQLLEVVQRDSNNMKAQLVLGIGGVISNQLDKAIARLNKVVSAQPENLEAISWLADAYAAEGDKANATRWYQQAKKLVNNPAFGKEVDQRIKDLNSSP
jgi:tetratricopeptide (TPR) repeat protein